MSQGFESLSAHFRRVQVFAPSRIEKRKPPGDIRLRFELLWGARGRGSVLRCVFGTLCDAFCDAAFEGGGLDPPHSAAARLPDMVITRLEVMLPSNRRRVAEPLRDLMSGEVLDPVGLARGPEILEQPRPWFNASPTEDPTESGAKVRRGREAGENPIDAPGRVLPELPQDRLENRIYRNDSDALPVVVLGLGRADGHHDGLPVDVAPAEFGQLRWTAQPRETAQSENRVAVDVHRSAGVRLRARLEVLERTLGEEFPAKRSAEDPLRHDDALRDRGGRVAIRGEGLAPGVRIGRRDPVAERPRAEVVLQASDGLPVRVHRGALDMLSLDEAADQSLDRKDRGCRVEQPCSDEFVAGHGRQVSHPRDGFRRVRGAGDAVLQQFVDPYGERRSSLLRHLSKPDRAPLAVLVVRDACHDSGSLPPRAARIDVAVEVVDRVAHAAAHLDTREVARGCDCPKMTFADREIPRRLLAAEEAIVASVVAEPWCYLLVLRRCRLACLRPRVAATATSTWRRRSWRLRVAKLGHHRASSEVQLQFAAGSAQFAAEVVYVPFRVLPRGALWKRPSGNARMSSVLLIMTSPLFVSVRSSPLSIRCFNVRASTPSMRAASDAVYSLDGLKMSFGFGRGTVSCSKPSHAVTWVIQPPFDAWRSRASVRCCSSLSLATSTAARIAVKSSTRAAPSLLCEALVSAARSGFSPHARTALILLFGAR